MHDNGVIHRDIKPSNILVNLNEDGNVKDLNIADFGYAVRYEQGESLQSMVNPRLGIDAPELLIENNHNYNEKVDSWSLGITLYYLVTKEFPFKRK